MEISEPGMIFSQFGNSVSVCWPGFEFIRSVSQDTISKTYSTCLLIMHYKEAENDFELTLQNVQIQSIILPLFIIFKQFSI